MQTLESLLSDLIRFPSVTPEDAGCQQYIIEYLENLGFQCFQYNNPPVSNVFARIGNQDPLLIFAGHTDVVPVGDLNKWYSDPFELKNDKGILYGRGVADMKGSLASMLSMAKQFIQHHPTFQGSLGFIITSGEEGDHFHLGTPFVMEQLKQKNQIPAYCIVGEPSSTYEIADVIKIGRRGSLSANIFLHGTQGHVAYPHLAENPIHAISPALTELTAMEWDKGNDYFPPSTMQITGIHSGGHGGNIIPGELQLDLNFRYSTEQNAEKLKRRVFRCLSKYGLEPEIKWRLNGEPFLTAKGKLLQSIQQAVKKQTGSLPELSTSGGTSDARFIAPYGVEVIELGPVNQSIHQVNETVLLKDLITLEAIFYNICQQLLK